MLEYMTPNDPKFFGADDAETIQNAIAAAVADGSRKLVIPRYNLRTRKTQWRIDRAIRIPSDFTVLLDNCYMVQETGIYDHMFCNEMAHLPENQTLEAEQHDITLMGVGNVILDGGVHNHLMEKTSNRYGMPTVWYNTMIYWENVRNLRVENLLIKNQRWWAITNLFCRNGSYKNITFESIPHVPNMDGIDLRVGCHDFTLENITGRTGDDVVALTGVKGKYEWSRLVEGKDTNIHDVSIRNVLGDPFIHYVVRILNHDGNCNYNIHMDTVYDTSDFTDKKRPRCTLGIGSVRYFSGRRAAPGETRNITGKHMTSRGEECIRIDNTLEDSHFTNIKTYGDNLVAVGTFCGTQVHNVVVEDVYYGTTQQEIFCSKDLNPESYIGNVVNLFDSHGDLTMKNVHVDKVNTVFKSNGELQITVDGYDCFCALKTAQMDGGKLVIDGEVVENG